MSDDTDYESISKLTWDSIPEVKLLPTGTWLLKCRGTKYQPPKDADKSAQVVFIYEPIEPQDDVDDAAITMLGPKYNYSENRIFHRMWAKSASDWDKIGKHLALHGITDIRANYADPYDAVKAAKNCDVLGYVIEETFNSKKTGKSEPQNSIQFFQAP